MPSSLFRRHRHGDEGWEDDDVEDAADILKKIKLYMEMAVAAYKSSSMAEKFDMVERSDLIHNVTGHSHLLAGVAGCTDTEVHVCILHDQTVVMAFRGTEPTEWTTGFADVVTDLDQRQEPVKLYNRSDQAVFTAPPHIRAHRGFQLALKDVTDTRIPTQNLSLVLENLGMRALDVRSVVCVGHSLGGALATLCAKWCREVAFPEAIIGCVTLGSPRVGNTAFALDFDSRVVNGLNYRVVNRRDVVPSIPNLVTYPIPTSPYKHVGKPIYFYRDAPGQISSRFGGARPTLLNLGFHHHLGRSYLKSMRAVLKR